MEKMIEGNQWVWVVVQDPDGHEQFLGQHDEEKGESFIPAFLDKDEAQSGLHLLTLSREHKYELQAIMFEDLAHHAAENGFMLFVLNGTGDILEKINP